ncbi:hypothetical protein NJD71_10035 [Psychrobacter sp. PP-21]|uniref:hypothetical protein n=1 Tax=Psychrobacter sp. PP-21 TaxID=2957503 RepID=UPI0029BE3F7F|nr:hypothetical protein [Psychrobacter sp. PP-21]MDX2374463.1 hypothetical protein [Psychrobacter sp. PP-21]
MAPTTTDISQVPLDDLVSEVINIGNTVKDRDEWGMMSWGGTAFLPVNDGDIIKESPMKDLIKYADASTKKAKFTSTRH